MLNLYAWIPGFDLCFHLVSLSTLHHVPNHCLSAAHGELHSNGDFVKKNFEIRQSSCDGETQVLKAQIAEMKTQMN
jgi:hypothetical protein